MHPGSCHSRSLYMMKSTTREEEERYLNNLLIAQKQRLKPLHELLRSHKLFLSELKREILAAETEKLLETCGIGTLAAAGDNEGGGDGPRGGGDGGGSKRNSRERPFPDHRDLAKLRDDNHLLLVDIQVYWNQLDLYRSGQEPPGYGDPFCQQNFYDHMPTGPDSLFSAFITVSSHHGSAEAGSVSCPPQPGHGQQSLKTQNLLRQQAYPPQEDRQNPHHRQEQQGNPSQQSTAAGAISFQPSDRLHSTPSLPQHFARQVQHAAKQRKSLTAVPDPRFAAPCGTGEGIIPEDVVPDTQFSENVGRRLFLSGDRPADGGAAGGPVVIGGAVGNGLLISYPVAMGKAGRGAGGASNSVWGPTGPGNSLNAPGFEDNTAPLEESWNCPRCTFLNHPDLFECEACGMQVTS